MKPHVLGRKLLQKWDNMSTGMAKAKGVLKANEDLVAKTDSLMSKAMNDAKYGPPSPKKKK